MAANGDFVIAWANDNRDNVPSSLPVIYAREYSANGVPKGDQFQVNNIDSNKHFYPKVGVDQYGNFLIGWRKYNVATGETDVFARYYANPYVQTLSNGQSVYNLSGSSGTWQFFKISVPAGKSLLSISISGSSGDADLYVKRGSIPGPSNWDYRPYLNGSYETVQVSSPAGGDWYIGVNGYTNFSGVTLNATFY